MQEQRNPDRKTEKCSIYLTLNRALRYFTPQEQEILGKTLSIAEKREDFLFFFQMLFLVVPPLSPQTKTGRKREDSMEVGLKSGSKISPIFLAIFS